MLPMKIKTSLMSCLLINNSDYVSRKFKNMKEQQYVSNLYCNMHGKKIMSNMKCKPMITQECSITIWANWTMPNIIMREWLEENLNPKSLIYED